ncbi:FUSC family protein [Streptomyces adustus]|uniref:FUSC family protein n=1 Tax=Streptomyces adustus TaxID=1609272 RepID=UPI003717DF13
MVRARPRAGPNVPTALGAGMTPRPLMRLAGGLPPRSRRLPPPVRAGREGTRPLPGRRGTPPRVYRPSCGQRPSAPAAGGRLGRPLKPVRCSTPARRWAIGSRARPGVDHAARRRSWCVPTFVHKPGFGPVLRRVVPRCVGTVVGVAVTGAVALLTGNTPYALIGTVAVFGALMAVEVWHHYAVATTGLAGIVFVLVDLLGDHWTLYGTWPRPSC